MGRRRGFCCGMSSGGFRWGDCGHVLQFSTRACRAGTRWAEQPAYPRSSRPGSRMCSSGTGRHRLAAVMYVRLRSLTELVHEMKRSGSFPCTIAAGSTHHVKACSRAFHCETTCVRRSQAERRATLAMAGALTRCSDIRYALVAVRGNLAGECDRDGESGLRPRLEDLRPVRTMHSRAWSPASRPPRLTLQLRRGNSRALTVVEMGDRAYDRGWRTCVPSEPRTHGRGHLLRVRRV